MMVRVLKKLIQRENKEYLLKQKNLLRQILMKIKVFFNNSCYVCRKEINHYKNICKDNFNWIDINNNQTAKKLTSKSFKELLRRIHVIENNRVISGAEAFLIIWKNIPRLNFLYKIFKIKPLFLIFFCYV